MLCFEFMTKKHINQVLEIEEMSFSIPWSKKSLKDEITTNKFATYIVGLVDDKIVGYAGMWHVINEGHITNIAVHPDYRRKGYATEIIHKLEEIAQLKEMIGLTLEVRVGNKEALKLYDKLGFKMEGIRKEYYSDTKEDALVMWKYFTYNN